MKEKEVKEAIKEAYEKVFGIEIPKDHLEELYLEWERVRDTMIEKGLPKENAEQIALETIKAGITLGKLRLERGVY